MAKKRFIAAFSPDAGEVAAEVSPSSSAGPIRRRRSPDPPAAAPLRRFEDFPVLPRTRQPTKSYLGVRQRRWGTWVAEITDRETHTRRWLGSFHTAELAAMEYDRWQVRYHGAAARLNFPFGTRPVHLVPPEPGVVSSAMAREDREAWERLEAEAADEAYMQELRRQHPELVEAERAIFASAEGGEVIALSSDDEVEGGEDGGAEGGKVITLSTDDEVEGGGDGGAEGVEVGPEDEEIDVDEWRSAFPNDPDDGTGPDPARGTPYMTRKDWLDLYFDRK